jgi:hypothetical protein
LEKSTTTQNVLGGATGVMAVFHLGWDD